MKTFVIFSLLLISITVNAQCDKSAIEAMLQSHGIPASRLEVTDTYFVAGRNRCQYDKIDFVFIDKKQALHMVYWVKIRFLDETWLNYETRDKDIAEACKKALRCYITP